MEDLKIFERILRLDSLKPSEKTNDAFFDLVEFCKNNSNINLQESQVEKLRKLSSIAEYEMEAYWAKKILLSRSPTKEIKKFWYYTNYEQLVGLEYANINFVDKKIKKVLFIGGGPFPLTSILLSEKYNFTCTILEKDKQSYEISLQLIKVLGLDTKIKIIHSDAQKYTYYATFDLIYVAALVGHNDTTKNKVITHIYNNVSKSKLLLCRSSHGTRKLLYSPISKALLQKIKPILEVRPYNSIINSFFILQKT